MHEKDIQTIEIKRNANGSFLKSFEYDWLRYLGFSEKEIEAEEIHLVIQADYSIKHKQPFIGIAKKR